MDKALELNWFIQFCKISTLTSVWFLKARRVFFKIASLQIVFLSVLVCPIAKAEVPRSAVTEGLAGTGTANDQDGLSVYRAPALMMLSPRYTLHMDGRYTGAWSGIFSMQDSRTTIGAGVVYEYTYSKGPPASEEMPGWLMVDEEIVETTRQQEARLALGYGLQEGRLALGVGLHYNRDNSDLSGLLQGFDLDLSVAGRPTPGLTLAATAHDVIPGSWESVSAEAGVWWAAPKSIALGADFVWSEDRPGGRIGVQLVSQEGMGLRLGYAQLGATGQAGGGVFLRSDVGSIDYGVGWNLFELDDVDGAVFTGQIGAGNFQHTLGINLMLDALKAQSR